MPHQLTLCEIHNCLRRHQALIVHFSSVPNVSDFDLYFPNDIKGVIAGNAMQGGLCCSAVKPGDAFHGAEAHSFGTIGVIVDLREPESLRAVSVGDGGALVINGKREFDERQFGLTRLEESLRRPSKTHNEWGIRNYIVRGVFVASPIEVARCDGGRRELSIQHARDLFPEQRLYTFMNSKIVELHPRGNAAPTEHAEIYKK